MRRLPPVKYLIALTALVCWTGCKPPGPKALLEGERLIKEAKYPEAVAKLQSATQLLPSNAQAWNHLGLAHQYAGQSAEALRAYQQAVSLDRNSAVIRFNIGALHLEQGRLEDAMAELTTATVLDPNSLVAWLHLGKAQLKARRFEEAERTYLNALRVEQGNAEAMNYLGVINLQRRKAREAAGYFNAALQKQPDYAPAILNQAILYHHYIVNKTNALNRYRKYLEMSPDAEGEKVAGEGVKVLEAELQPKSVVVAAVTNTPPVATNRPIAVAPATTNRMVAAVTNLPVRTNLVAATNATALAGREPGVPRVTNRPPATNVITVAALPKPVTNAPPPAPPKTNVVAAVVTNTPPPKIEVEKEPEPEPEPAKPLEVVKVDVDDQEIKIAPAKDVVEPKPETKVAAARPAPLPDEREQTAAAATNSLPPLIRPARREEKQTASTLLQKANPLNWFKRDKDEEKVVANKTESEPVKAAPVEPRELPPVEKDPEPEPKPEPVFARYPYSTTALPAAGNRKAAETPFNEAVTAHEEGKIGRAMDGYRAAIRLHPRFFEAHLNLGIAAAQASDLSLALASLEDAVRIDPKSAEARYQFAMALRRANYPLDAVNELKTLTEYAPNEARAYLAMGNLYAQVLNKPGEASLNYQRVLAIEPRHPQAAQIRGWLADH